MDSGSDQLTGARSVHVHGPLQPWVGHGILTTPATDFLAMLCTLKRCLVLPIDPHLASSVTNLYLKGIIALLLCIWPGLNLHHTRQPKFGPYRRPVSSLSNKSRHLLSTAQPSPTQPTDLALTRLDRSPSHSPLDHTTVDRLVLSTCSFEPPTRPDQLRPRVACSHVFTVSSIFKRSFRL